MILARTGQFNEDGANMAICPRHRAEYGIYWRPRRKCAHPLHGNRKGKPERGATLEMSKEILSKWNELVPVGAGKDTLSLVVGYGILKFHDALGLNIMLES